MQDYVKGLIFDAVFAWLRALPSQILDTIGWSGVIAILAGCIMLATLSAKAVAFMTSKRGMAITAGVFAAALLALWFWSKPDAKAPAMVAKTEPPVVKQPVVVAAKESMPTKAFDLFGVEELEEDEDEAPAAPKRRSNLIEPPPWLVGSPIVPGPVAFALPPTPQIPAPVVRPGASIPHAGTAGHRTQHHTTVAAAPQSRHVPAGSPAHGTAAQAGGNRQPAGSAADSASGGSSQQSSRQAQQAARRAAIRQQNARAAIEFENAMGQMMHEQHLIHSGQHPAMGMHGGHHMGGHPATHHGGGHPAAHHGAAHAGGHR
jgi:hypothetical protein